MRVAADRNEPLHVSIIEYRSATTTCSITSARRRGRSVKPVVVDVTDRWITPIQDGDDHLWNAG